MIPDFRINLLFLTWHVWVTCWIDEGFGDSLSFWVKISCVISLILLYLVINFLLFLRISHVHLIVYVFHIAYMSLYFSGLAGEYCMSSQFLDDLNLNIILVIPVL